ncbi:outer membrane beta-barrel protein [Flavobacterium sp. Sd200]|uniref:outer membrane beta-barrel protein n=1 Tax=Flavobacterium sp. Sd200 TaxID=2692211 RepID=UPI0013710C7C|nr:outer membrane beta-barrel protein [Flavobacterium sp. Sd200]MXN91091.1 outer membrane beta-barrel protein [Flavobacterium sp. Sd200]
MQKLLTLLLLACTCIGYSQSITLKGKVSDPDNFPLEAATVYLTTAKDSTMIDYTITNKNGNWELKTRAITQPVFLKISFVGFADHKQKFETLAESKDFGTIKMADRSTNLNEVVIEGETPPIRVKADTLEFNASSFKVRPDASVEALLKQLPGVEIDEEGKITVNGKEVNQILVNGKPFFDKDGKIAIQNLPAEIINKVQVSDTKTKKEELSGDKASGNNASINLTIDEDKNKGFFGRAMAGYGSSERYESSALVNYFKGARKISLLASSNNINSTGFSMNEIFDNMGGGRNMNVWTSDDGGFNINGMQFGGGKGITLSNIIGLNYADEWVKGFDGSANYFFTSANTDNNNRTREVNYLPLRETAVGSGIFVDDSYVLNSQTVTKNDKYAHNFNTEFNVKIDSTTTIYVAPKFSKANSMVKNTTSQASRRLSDDTLLNDREGLFLNENDNTAFNNSFVFSKVLGKSKRSIDVWMDNEIKEDEGSELNKSNTNKYNYDAEGNVTIEADNRDQIRYNRQKTDSHVFAVEFTQPIPDSLEVRLGLTYTMYKNTEDRNGYNFDVATGRYSAYNDLLSNSLESKRNAIRPTAGFRVNKGKIWAYVEGGPRITKFDNNGTYLGQNYAVNKNYILPFLQAGMNYSFTKSKSLWIGGNYEVEFPLARQILEIADVTDPLNTVIGNAELDPEKYYNLHFNFRNYDYATRSGYNIYAGGNYYDSSVRNFTEIDNSAVSTTTYTNVSGTFTTWFGVNWSKSIKREAHTFKASIGVNGNYNGDKGFQNEQLYNSKSLRVSPRLNLTYEYGELLTINPSYNFTYSDTKFTNYVIDRADNFVHRLNLQTTSYWPKHIVFGNDFGYTYNSQLGSGLKKDFFLWNSSIGYNFYNDRLLFKVKVYDLLNQNLATSRTISATRITDEENVVLKRYVMFSLTFKLNKFGEKKADEGNRFWWF